MEKLQHTSILRFHPDTLDFVRSECGTDEVVIEKALETLDEWLLQQDHIMKKDFCDEYKERFLICCKGSVDRTKEKMDKMCKIRTTHPKFFDSFDARADHEEYGTGLIDALLPSLTPKHERVYFINNVGFKGKDFMGYYRHFIKIAEYMRRHDYSTGVHLIGDLSEANIMELVTKINPVDLINCVNICVDAFSMRFKSMHLITTSKVIDVLVRIVKQAVGSKLRKRIHVHQSFEDVYKEFPKEMMPKDYGGSEKTLQELNDDLDNALASEEFVKYLKDMSLAVTNEKLRKKTSYFERIIGFPGSFKKLSID